MGSAPAQRRVQGALAIVDELLRLAARHRITIDGYSWNPDPSAKRAEDFYFLTSNSGARHSQAKFSRAYLEEAPKGVNRDVTEVLEEMMRALRD